MSMYYVTTPHGVIPCRCHGTALAIARELGGLITRYNPQLVFIPPEPPREREAKPATMALAA